ncbi:Na+/H+ antiporter [Caulobacter mirabilis]|uniref:Na+/H+ antiporter n=1 Tax=Caulobacter mirabilis TaxID=69666 RepID=A0A2D2AZT5_9CAUL|nr:Na+/H+ antiporter [Caulobacter mirabilis]ATQ43505.1 Na+/H+ antiporter [Caulobacter mirabilis]
MQAVEIVLVLLLAVVVSGAVSRMLPLAIPRPLIQIAFGAVIGLVADWRVTLNPELFFLLFLPPLLFLDGWRIPRENLFRDRTTIVQLALWLVIFTVLGMGLLIHWMIPAMPLPVAFALAAVISPTDPIAVAAITRKTPMPSRMMHILEGEALLNDASGLVCLRFAVAAALTGTFSIFDAAGDFLWMALGGLAIGVAVTWSVTRVTRWLSRRFGEESGSQILVSLLIPFGAYLAAEEAGCSGILAAVAAGVTMSVVETTGQALAVTRIRRNTVWGAIQFAANGAIFILLGEQLPGILDKAAHTVRSTGHHDPWWLAIYVVAIVAALAALRFAWVWVSLRFTLRQAGKPARPNWRIVAAMSVAGVRGAITLAGVLTLPLVMRDGSAFPARELAIFLAMGVIIVSLITATVFLPMLLKGLQMPSEPGHDRAENAARVAAAHAAIAAIEKAQHDLSKGRDDADLYVEAAGRIMPLYRQRIESRSFEGEAAAMARLNDAIERDLRLAGLKAERSEIFRRVRARELDSETAGKLVREIDLLETRFDDPMD